MTKLRIGPLPDDRPVKRTITFTAALDALIRDYAAAIAAQDGLADAPSIEKLVPIIVERFITTDRAFRAPASRTPVLRGSNPSPGSEQPPSTHERRVDRPTIPGPD